MSSAYPPRSRTFGVGNVDFPQTLDELVNTLSHNHLMAQTTTTTRHHHTPQRGDTMAHRRNPQGQRQGQGNNRGHDLTQFNFHPSAIAMGSLIGRQFVQMLGAKCRVGHDYSMAGRDRNRENMGTSFLAFDFNREVLHIKASLEIDPKNIPPALRPLDAELSFDDIASQGIVIEATNRNDVSFHGAPRKHVTVTVTTRRPPRFFTEFERNDELLGMGHERERTGKLPYRRRATAMDFATSTVTELKAGAIQAIPEGPCAYPTFWNTFRWTFDLTQVEFQRLMRCSAQFKDLANDDPEMDLLSHKKHRWSTRKLTSAEYLAMYGTPDLSKVLFSSRTLIEGLIGHGILKPGDVPQLLAVLPRSTEFADRILESLYNEERVREVEKVIRAKARYLRKEPPPPYSHLVMIRSVLVTPTRLLIGPPQQEPSNSVTRRYADRLEAIVRVQFTDEEDRLHVAEYTKQADELQKDVGIMARVRRALWHGITIGGRTYMPVASSSSQQKEHAIWFIDNKKIDFLELKSWMGNVAETIVAKHAARMGLPFSTSRIVQLDIKLGREINDVERNEHCFTDGVAVAGIEIMKEAARTLGATKGLNSTPSAIQFRLGGAKGVLTCWPQLADKLEVRLRPSLIKFRSTLQDLNVVRIAKYQTAFLNRQFIMMMCANGVPENLIIRIFQENLRSIRGLKQRVRRGAASKEDYKLMSVCSEFPLNQLIRAGFHADPLVLDVVEIIECRLLQDLKWRARVKIPAGVFLIGIADESGTLKANEVFCQYQESDETEPVIVQSEILICRAPALHPGDVRRAFAVDRPELRHLKNVIVFSVQGERPLPNMLGGGDLDGDDYTLIWDQEFVRPLRVYGAMDYKAPPPKRVDKVTQADLNENFVQYMLNDVLGQVDNCHLAKCDIGSPFDNDCIELSKTHSIAVDFPKTGHAATLEPRLRPKEWPDFMDKDGTKKIYQSEKILGKLFKLVNPEPNFRPCDIKELDYPVDQRLSHHPIYSTLLDKLRPIKDRYEAAVLYDMRRYRVCEPEIPSGMAVRNPRRKRIRDQNLNEPLRDAYNAHVGDAREAAKEAIEGISFTTNLTGMQVVARHAYALTYERVHVEAWQARFMLEAEEHGAADEDKEVLRPRPMTSFAWVFWQELIQIVTGPNL
ncbi:RNA dependent RNA polymerase-domain-containing protein [Naematelia encephala]|uniref:RNA-dependent RNA polymerase n=1 Tax=Naematelia encephala TaxID=71784 RepID=A0A1Y2BLR5_9TREE|nr:RNA dependent RNA polymerase-domain-containing protein [Naematelia encephala]